MFLIKANTFIQVEVSKALRSFNWSSWIPYKTKEDKIYEKEEVYDYVRVSNNAGIENIPHWIVHNVLVLKKVVVKRNDKYALVNLKDIVYID